jgi:hypothetical protein
MKLGYILAGIGRGPRKPDHDGLIQAVALLIAQIPQTRPARRRTIAAQGLYDRPRSRSADPKNRDRGHPDSGHGCEDCVIIHQVLGCAKGRILNPELC